MQLLVVLVILESKVMLEAIAQLVTAILMGGAGGYGGAGGAVGMVQSISGRRWRSWITFTRTGLGYAGDGGGCGTASISGSFLQLDMLALALVEILVLKAAVQAILLAAANTGGGGGTGGGPNAARQWWFRYSYYSLTQILIQ
jgi:hypothetical protein